MDEARLVCDFIEQGGDAAPLVERFGEAASPGFDFDARPGARRASRTRPRCSPSESLAIAGRLPRGDGARATAPRQPRQQVRIFDTICSATQERQDAVLELLEDPLDLMIVVGGYNSSNTTHLAALAASHGVRTYHIEDAECIDPEAGTIRHQPVGRSATWSTTPAGCGDARVIGITAGRLHAEQQDRRNHRPGCGHGGPLDRHPSSVSSSVSNEPLQLTVRSSRIRPTCGTR